MHNDRICDLGEEVRNFVFQLLDSEPDIDGMEAGRIAHKAEQAFLDACHEDPIQPDLTREDSERSMSNLLHRINESGLFQKP